MPESLSTICILSLILFSCNQTAKYKDETSKKVQSADTEKYSGLQGTWVRYTKRNFTLIEIKDTSNVLYYQFIERKPEMDKITTDHYWYYRSIATMGYWDNSTIWVATDKFRFDYKLKSDTLIEFDKMGDQGKFIKVYTDEQKAFKEFKASNLNRKITKTNNLQAL